MFRFAWIAAAALSLQGAASAGAAEEVYRRVTVLEDRVGRVSVRAAYQVPLTVPVECPSNPRGCNEEHAYDQVLRLDFVLQRREADGAEVFRSEDPAGTILVALALPPADLEAFRVELGGRLQRLSAQAFVEPFAGWRPMTPPFDQGLPALPGHPTWVCFRSGTATTVAEFNRRVHERAAGDEYVSTGSSTYREPPTPLCDEMTAATEDVFPDIVETLPVPRRLREVAVFHVESVRIDTKNPETLIARPAGVQFFKQKADEAVMTAEGTGEEGGVFYAVQLDGGWLRGGYAAPAAMPIDALSGNAWLHGWAIETIERQLGPRPTQRVLERSGLNLAYLATVPAAILDEEWDGSVSSKVPAALPSAREVVPDSAARIDSSAFLDALAARLDRYHGPPEDLLEEVLTRPEAGLVSEGWIAVLCHGDGTATYHLPPTKAHNSVVNADLFCAGVESRLGR